MKKRVVAGGPSMWKLLVALPVVAGSLCVATGASAANEPVLFANTGMSSVPSSLTTDSSGNVYVVRSSPSAVAKITAAGALTATWATAPNGNSWTRVVTGPANAIYASGDTGSNPIIQKLAADGSAQNYSTNASDRPTEIAVDANGNIFYITTGGTSTLGKITAGNTVASTVTLNFQTSSIALDASGNVYVAGRASNPTTSKLVRYSNDLTSPHDYGVDYGSANGCILTAREQYVYCANAVQGSSASRVARISGLTFDSAWATIPGSGQSGPDPKAMQVGSDGFLYVASSMSGMTGQTGVISKISPSGATTELATMAWAPSGLAVDPSTNVFVSRMGMGPSAVSGVYKVAQATPEPTPTPAPAPAPAPTPAATTLATPSVNTSAPGQNAVVTVRVQLAQKGKYTFIFEKPTSNEMSREQATSSRVPMQKGTRIGTRRLKKTYTAAVITTTADNAKVVTRALLRKAQAKKLNLRVVYAPTGTAQSESVIKIK